LAGEPEVALGLPLVGADDEATGCEDDSAGWEVEPTGCTSLAEIVELEALASGPVPEEVGGRMPLETDDRDKVPSGPEEALVGLGGRMGFGEYDEEEVLAGVEEAGELPAGTEEADEAPSAADEEPAGPEVLLVGEGGRIGFGEEAPTGSDVAVMTVVDEEVRVMGQTVVETAMTMVLTGQSLMPALQL
jgi:hypothetical protein